MPTVPAERVPVPLSSPQGVATTSAVLWHPPAERAGSAFVLAHGAGTDMTHLSTIARGLARRGHPAAAFNFAYAEAGRRRPDPMGRLESAYRDALAALRPRLGGRPIVIGGRSMGGRVASHLAARGEVCAGLCLLSYPLHPAGRPERLRTGHWPALRQPVLFISGDRDPLCSLTLLERERAARLTDAADTVHVLRGADHGFAVRRRDARTVEEVLGEVVDAITAWARTLAAGGTPA